MTRIESVVVEGFKGIDQLRFDSGTLNVVTGRNNSGKTSLLEAIDLAVHPSHISNFGENLDTLINHHHDESRIEIETDDGVRELRLSKPEKERVPRLVMKSVMLKVYEVVDEVTGSDLSTEEKDDFLDQTISDLEVGSATQSDLDVLMNEIIVVEMDNTQYPYIYFDEYISDIYEQFVAGLENEIDDQLERADEYDSIPPSAIMEYSRSIGASGGIFVDGEPPAIDGLTHVDFMQLSETIELSDEDADPVKVDNVGDFLREKEIVENLKTFGLDDLVFEPEDGEKYSVPFEFMGEGFKTTVGVVWELLDENGPSDIVLLEEPETHMHPGYVRELIYFLVEVARTDDTQLFVTTHNNDFLNDLFTENLQPEEVEFLEEEFRLLQLQGGGADSMDYREAENQLKELKLDLRGL